MIETAIIGMTDFDRRYIKRVKQRKVWRLGKIALFECPNTWITRDTNKIIQQMFLIAENQGLVFPGTWNDQPLWVVEAWEIYKQERNNSNGSE